jgi:hypothetical protein
MFALADTEPLPSTTARQLRRYRSLRVSSATWWVSVCLLLYVPLWLLVGFSGSSDDEPAPTPAELWEAISCITVVILVGAAIQLAALAVWQFRAYENLRTFGVAPRQPGRSVIVLAWFVPVVNIVVSTRVLRDIWRGSAREASSNAEWRTLRVPATLTVWWLTYCSTIVGALTIIALLRPDEPDHVSWRHWLAYADLAVLFLAARGGRRIMVAVRDRHQRRAAELGLVPVELDRSDVDPDESGHAEAFDSDLLSWFAVLGPRGDGDDADDGDDGDGGDDWD